jgi:HK97 family phage prohead protease
MRDWIESPPAPIVGHGPRDEVQFKADVAAIQDLLAEMRLYASRRRLGQTELKAEIEGVRQFLAGIRLKLRRGQLEEQALTCELKAVALDEGEFAGVAAVYDALDLQGDRIEPGAFASSLAERRTFPLLFQHNHDEVLGIVEVADTSRGLRVHGQLNLAVARAKEIYALIKQGAIRGLSIGFSTLKQTHRDGARILQAIKLYEVSLTPFPAQPLATVEAVKEAPHV